MTEPGRPLAGRVVLVTRPRDRAAELAERLEELGARVDARPTIAFEAPVDPEPADRAVGRLADYDWVVFTSPTGVRSFLERAGRAGAVTERLDARVAAVGPGTARALEAVGIDVSLVAREGHAEGLGEALAERVGRGQRVLVVRPEVASDAVVLAVRDVGACPDPVAFYRTVGAPDVDAVARDVIDGHYDAVVFTSPSTFERLMDARGVDATDLERALGTTGVVAIGEVTARALREAGVRPSVVAAKPTPASLADAVRSLFPGPG